MIGLALSAAMLLPPALRAQGTLSTQGLGYPIGALSARTLSVGGATAETDPVSAVNPAALATWGAAGVAMQLTPENRTLRGPNGNASTNAVRFPLYTAAVNLGSSWLLGASTSTMLDRTWESEFHGSQDVNGQTVQSTTIWNSQGAVNELRLAIARRVGPSLSAGVGLHILTGANDLRISTDYAGNDFLDLSVQNQLEFSGRAVSAGVLFESNPGSVGLSFRSGGTIAMRSHGIDSLEATVPSRFGVSASYRGIGGVILSGRFEHVAFSDLSGLVEATQRPTDTQDIGLGAEFGGPSILRGASIFRVGARWRDLPFPAIGATVNESSYSLGVGLAVVGNSAMLDLGAIRVLRSNGSAFSERAWIIAAGILIRP
jgi:hypothetical protein